ncbi:MAG: alpha/beta hydrolase [Bacteroidota bacterium]
MIYHYKDAAVFYQVTGTGPPLVLIHGFLERSTIWFRLIPELSKHRTVITLDLPGHGRSDSLAAVHTMELLAEVIKDLLRELTIEKAGFVGHSMGGYVLLALVEQFPAIVDELFLLNSTSLADSKERLLNRRRALEIISRNKQKFVHTAIANLFTSESRTQYPNEIATLKEEASSFSADGITAMIRGMMARKDLTDILAQFPRRKVLLCGNTDPVVALGDSKWIAARTNSEIKIMDGGHMSWLENTSELLKFGF